MLDEEDEGTGLERLIQDMHEAAPRFFNRLILFFIFCIAVYVMLK